MLHNLIISLWSPILLTGIASSASIERIHFEWSDINTREVVEWDGDIAQVRQGASMQDLSCLANIDSGDIDFAIERFGIPKSWTSISYTDAEDLKKKQQDLKIRASKYGIKMLDKKNRYVVDYAWVVKESENDIRGVAKSIRSSARKEGYRSRRELIGAFSSLVQSLDYRIPADYRHNDEGEEILTVGAMMPLETLSKKWGDCDSKSLLFASLVKSINLAEVLFIAIDEHIFVAVDLPPTNEDHSISYNRNSWVLIEMTDAWPVGRVPVKHLEGVMNNRYTVVELH